jgi:hypothetical protein
MKTIIGLFIFFLFLSCNENKYASLETKKDFNFGERKIGDTIICEFKLKNVSKIPLKIEQIATSCGCTVAKITDSVIMMNESKILTVNFIPTPNKIGNVKNSIVINSNTNPNFTVLHIIGKINN